MPSNLFVYFNRTDANSQQPSQDKRLLKKTTQTLVITFPLRSRSTLTKREKGVHASSYGFWLAFGARAVGWKRSDGQSCIYAITCRAHGARRDI